MNKDIVRMKCDRILQGKQPQFSKLLNNRIAKVYQEHENAIGATVDFKLLTHFTDNLLTAYSGVVSEIMVEIIQEVLSDDDFESFDL